MIKEKNQAKAEYEKAKSEGKTATLLEQNRPNVFQMNVANILPGDSIIVELKYTEMLNATDGIYNFVYPQIVLPRYSETGEEWNEQLATQFTESTEGQFVDLNIDVDFDIKITINAGIPIENISSTFHQIITKNQDFISEITLQDSEKKLSKNDFILKYSLKGKEIQSGLMVFETDSENYFALIVQPPEKIEQKQIPPREYIFIVDVSGSMSGFSIETAKLLMFKLLKNLRKEDIFNIIAFSDKNKILFGKSCTANDMNIEIAEKFLKDIINGGGTNFLPALKAAFDFDVNENYSRSFVVLTDGGITAETEALKLVRENLNTANLFAIGIGAYSNRYLINSLAYSGMGDPFFIENNTLAENYGDSIIGIISSPVLTNIKIDYKDVEVYDVEPKSVPDVFANRPVMIYGKYKNNNNGKIYFSAFSGENNFCKEFEISNAENDENSALKFLWARNRIKYLSDYEAYFNEYTSTEKIKEVTDLGLKYGLLTEYTSFIAIDSISRELQGCNDKAESGLDNSLAEISNDNYDKLELNMEFNEYETITYQEIDLAENYVEEEAVDEVFLIVEDMPEYPGGEVALKQYISENISYPQEAIENDIQGTVYVRFVIRATGEIGDVTIVRGVDPLLDAEAIRLVKSLPKWKPGSQRGKDVDVWYVVPIKFILE